MLALERSDMLPAEREASARAGLFRIGALAALLQLAAILAYALVLILLGPGPSSVAELYALQQSNRLASVLRGDFLLLFLIGGYLGTFPALYVALRKLAPVAVMFATIFTLMAVLGSFLSESTFSLLYLGDRYAAATNAAERTLYLAAGEAIVAGDFWNGTGAYVGGILLQGGGVIISLVMLRDRGFSRVTAIAGLLGNAIDLAQHLIHPFTPGLAETLKAVMGPFYMVWFPMLARDLFRLSGRPA